MTRETMLLCEAAGFDVVLVETVGVGQSETVVAGMVDLFLALMLPGAGDELQGIKKGLLEIADLIAVNKADGDNLLRARQAAAHYAQRLRIIEPESPTWRPAVVGQRAHRRRPARAVAGDPRHRARWRPRASSRPSGAGSRCTGCARCWRTLIGSFAAHPGVRALLPELEEAVAADA